MAMGTVAATPRVGLVWPTDDVAEFIREWRPHVLAFFLSYGVPVDDADDLTQIVFVAILKQWEHLHPDEREGRLWTIAHHRHVDFRRRNARWAHLSLPLTDVIDPPSPASDPACVVLRQDTVQRVRIAVEHEKPEHRQLLHERYVEGRPYEDIARERGTTAGALRNVMSRAHDRLRTRLSAVDVRSLVPFVPGIGWRWTRRSAAPPWVAAAGNGAFVSLVATTILMVPPSAVPAAATPTGEALEMSERQAPRRTALVPIGPREVAGATEHAGRTATTSDPEGGDYGRKQAAVPLPQVSLQPLPEPPCVGTCENPSEGITVHTPLGPVRQEQNIVPACDFVPGQQSVVTCDAEDGTNYAVSAPPRPVEG